MKGKQMDWPSGIKNNDNANDDVSIKDLENTSSETPLLFLMGTPIALMVP